MDADTLRKHGFDLSTGHVYRDNKLYGTFTVVDGVTKVQLNDAGRARFEELTEEPRPAPTAEPKKPASKSIVRRTAVQKPEPEPTLDGSLMGAVDELLN